MGEIRRVPEGLLFEGVTTSRGYLDKEPSLEGVRRVVVNLPDTELGSLPRELETRDPLILRVRIVRYRSENEHGVRVRADLLGYPQVSLEVVAEGVLLRILEPATATPPRIPAAPARALPAPGAFSFWGNATAQPASGSTATTTLSTDVAVGQVIPNLFSLEGRFLYGESDGTQNLLRYTLVTRGFDLGRGTATAGAGDLLIRFGGVGGVATSVGESLDMRGGALRLVSAGRFVLELFGGRARGAPLLVPIGENLTINSEFSGDRVYGGFLSGPLWEGRFRLGLGWAHTVSAVPGTDRDNRFVEVGWKPASLFEAGVRVGDVSGTRLDGSHLNGILFGAQVRLQTRVLDVDATYRHQDEGYVAPGGNQEFPGEKGSIVTASARPTKDWRLFASVSQSDAFPFRAPDQGPISSKGRFAGSSYSFGRTLLTASFSDLSQKSIGASVNPVDSETLSGGLTVGQRISAVSVSAGLGEERTRNHLNPDLDLEAKVATLNLNADLAAVAVAASGRYAITERVSTGEHLPDYGADVNLSYGIGATSFNVGAFAGRSPAGTALFSSDRVGVRGGVSTVLPAGFAVSATANYVTVRLGQGTRLTSQFYSLNLRKALDWGGGISGAMGIWDSGEAVSPVLAKAVVEGRVFVDANGNGRFDEGEPAIPGVMMQAEEVSGVSDAKGQYRLVLEPGRHTVRIIATTIPFSYQLSETEGFPVALSPRRHQTQDVLLTGFGNIEGTLTVQGETPTGEERSAAAWIGVTLHAEGVSRETLTGEDGSFRFANLPPGTYQVEIDIGAIGESYALEGPAVREVRVEVGKTASLALELRPLSLRERLERRRERN
ncbi:MAG: hypothetical protein ABI968_00175 [Acidobacteriota bacterium]